MNHYMPPLEIAEALSESSSRKACGKLVWLFISSILAGISIGLASHFATTVSAGWIIDGTSFLPGLKALLTGLSFCMGLILVVIPGFELFTGNCLMTIGLLNRKIRFSSMLRNWTVVYLGNFAGSLALALVIAGGTGLLDSEIGGNAVKIAWMKIASAPEGMNHSACYFWRAIPCNFLVCLAVLMAVSARDISGKILAMIFPLMGFVASGYEHSVANMYFIPAGIIAKKLPAAAAASGLSPEQLEMLDWNAMFTQNLLAVTAGNIIGGAVLAGIGYWVLYGRKISRP